ncbi:ubiquitin carboxyl-terminal hydrolase MINDY-1-like isoform X1 [Macrobrachium rosenbergii]|uniref:ubiquitin carboxyl-terminal hydrolase MINDY-1-like isoform X1 n=1 Tax=Macrobrachium rosenbergii TaxID=79674 RepID=UPI0034D429B3
MDVEDKPLCDGSESGKENSEHLSDVNSAVSATDTDASARSDQPQDLCSNVSQSSVSGSTLDNGRQCSSVPLQNPSVSSLSQKDNNHKVLENLTIVPTVNDQLSHRHVAGLPDLLTERSDHHQDSSVVERLSDRVGKLNDKKETDHEKSECSGAFTGSAQEESVLPSMGILPEVEETLNTPALPLQTSPSAPEEEKREKSSPEIQPVDPSSVVHKIKKIKWQDIEVPIITQNNNGPCPLLAIVNVMLLKGQITLPSDRSEITGGELVLVVGNALFDQPRNALPSDMRRHLEQNTEDAISILHKLLTGLDVNIKFSGVRDFEFTGELCIFDLLGIMLYHGWVVDPSSEVAEIIKGLSYNQLTNNIFAWREEAVKNNNNDLLVKAMLCEEFMANSGSQLTIHGLFELGSSLGKEEIAVLFRNNHFSTIYKRGDQIYQLLTDQGFLHENMVWETLNDVDATFSEFVNGNFQPVTPTAEASLSSSEGPQSMTMQQQINSDQQLAAMLQHEVDLQQRQQQSFERLKDSLGLHNMTDEEIAQKLQEEENRLAAAAEAAASHPRQTVPSSLPAYQTPNPSNAHEEKKKKENDLKRLKIT